MFFVANWCAACIRIRKINVPLSRKTKNSMKDFKNDSTATLSRFGKDKRTRTVKVERVERRPHMAGETEGREQSAEQPRRRSFNPNFDRENRPIHDNTTANTVHGSFRRRRPTQHNDRGMRSEASPARMKIPTLQMITAAAKRHANPMPANPRTAHVHSARLRSAGMTAAATRNPSARRAAPDSGTTRPPAGMAMPKVSTQASARTHSGTVTTTNVSQKHSIPDTIPTSRPVKCV